MPSKNGTRAKALELPPQVSPSELATLFSARLEVLLDLATTEAEQRVVSEQAVRGWEERPDVAKVLGKIERRVTDPDDAEILRRGRGFRRLLPESMPEPPPDPTLEVKIHELAMERVRLEAIAAVKLSALVGILAKVGQARKPAELEALKVEERAAIEEHKQAVADVERVVSRLSDLLVRRANRKRAAALLAESVRS